MKRASVSGQGFNMIVDCREKGFSRSSAFAFENQIASQPAEMVQTLEDKWRLGAGS